MLFIFVGKFIFVIKIPVSATVHPGMHIEAAWISPQYNSSAHEITAIGDLCQAFTPTMHLLRWCKTRFVLCSIDLVWESNMNNLNYQNI